MPYKQNYRKKFSRKTKYPRRKYSRFGKYINYGKKALALAMRLKGLINVEYKYHDVVATGSASVTPDINVLNAIPQGDTSQSRDGDSVKMKFLNIKGTVTMNSAATTPTYVRVTLVQVLQNNGASLPATNIWAASTGELFEKKRELKFVDTIKILKNYNIVLAPGAKQSQIINLIWKFNDHVKFKGTANTYADIMTNALFLVTSSASDTNKATISWSSRLRFIDN